MKHETSSKGFMLLEAILSVSLLTSGLVFSTHQDGKERQLLGAKTLGGDISTLMTAIDRRVFIDGYLSEGASWSQSWVDTSSAVVDGINSKFIGRGHDCGDSNGWVPQNGESDLSLIPCGMWHHSALPMEFDLLAEITSSSINSKVLDKWSYTLYHEDREDFERYFWLYPEIIASATAKSFTRSTGSWSFGYVDILTNEPLTVSGCENPSLTCGIKATYTAQPPPSVTHEGYLRVDGSNYHVGHFIFDGGSTPTCYRGSSATSGGVTTTAESCGFLIESDDSIHHVTGTVDSTSYKLAASTLQSRVDGAVLPVLCGSDSEPCGFSVMERDNSWVSELNVHTLMATHFLNLSDSTDTGYFLNVDETGVKIAKNLEAESLVIEGGNLTVSGEVSIDDIESTSATDFILDGDVEVAYDIKVTELVIDNLPTCTASIQGAISRSEGQLLVCHDAKWLEPLYPSGAVVPFNSATCPTGFVTLSSHLGGTNVAGRTLISGTQGALYGTESGGTDSLQFTSAHLPSHTHSYQHMNTHTGLQSGSSGAKRSGLTSGQSEAVGGGGVIRFNYQSRTTNYCVKL
ncbi:hypothetical protein VCHA53O466_140211 [Vibrio chagasii]|nr:hypothetical protein VCHA53O466_140211 [Vibrio chagasii]